MKIKKHIIKKKNILKKEIGLTIKKNKYFFSLKMRVHVMYLEIKRKVETETEIYMKN